MDETINFKPLEWQVGMTFSSIEKFKQSVIKYALVQGYDLKFNVSNETRKSI